MVARSDGRQDHTSEIGKSGVAKPSHFMMVFTTPDIVIQGDEAFNKGKNLDNTIGKLFKEEVGKFKTSEEIKQLIFKDYSEKIFFEIWQDLIIGAHRK